MIPRLDVAVERRASEPGVAGGLGGRHAALEPVTERLRGTIPILATDSGGAAELRAQGETLPDKLLAHIAPLGWEHMSFNGDYVWPSEPLKQGFRPCESCTPRFSMPLSVRFGTDSVMTPEYDGGSTKRRGGEDSFLGSLQELYLSP
jgi:Tn3 transposase DDE domain